MIDYSFIDQLEGLEPVGSVPRAENKTALDKSGVTVRGVDLGQMGMSELDRMGLSEALTEKLRPYIGHKMQAAIDLLDRNPLILAPEDAESLVQAKRGPLERALKRHYNAATGNAHTFDDLPDKWQTVIASMATQYGPERLNKRTPNFWNQVVARDWDAAIDNLRNFQDTTPTRRNREADYLAGP